MNKDEAAAKLAGELGYTEWDVRHALDGARRSGRYLLAHDLVVYGAAETYRQRGEYRASEYAIFALPLSAETMERYISGVWPMPVPELPPVVPPYQHEPAPVIAGPQLTSATAYSALLELGYDAEPARDAIREARENGTAQLSFHQLIRRDGLYRIEARTRNEARDRPIAKLLELAPDPDTDAAHDAPAPPADDLAAKAEEEVLRNLRTILNEFTAAYGPPENRTARFTIDGAAYCNVTPAQRATLMAIAPPGVRAINEAAPGGEFIHVHADDGTAEGCPGCFREPPQGSDSYPPPVTDELAQVLAAVELVDRWLDETASPEYRDNPLANQWRRLSAGPVMEAAEITEALNLSTGGNPRKGRVKTMDDALAEAADTAFSALLAIQSQTKNVSLTWGIFSQAMAKACSRVPEEIRHAPATGWDH